MGPIERDLENRKAELRQLAIEMQRLEEAPARRGTVAYREKNRELAAMRQRIEVLKFGISELEETVADYRRHLRDRERNVRPKRPDISRRRALTDKERKRIAADYRRKILAQMRAFGPDVDPQNLRVHVERVTDLNGLPICGYTIAEPGED
ncbi:MAG: hypothetical protein R3C46_11110 [Hyphomonadaceae bacterium]